MSRRRYQRGTLVERGDRWYGRWREDVLVDGRLKRVGKNEVLGTKKDYPTRRLALRALEQRLSTVNSPMYRARPTAKFADFSDRWDAMVLSQHKPSTQTAIRSYVRRYLKPAFGEWQLKDISTPLIQVFISESKLSPKTIRNLIATLRMMWNSAKAWGYVAHDPFQGIVLPRRQRPEIRTFSLDELKQILSNAEEPQRTFYWLAAETGMRAGELTGLTMEDIDLGNRIVRVRQSVWRGRVQTPKTHAAHRTFAISDALASRLFDIVSARSQDNVRLLFRTSRGTPWDANLVVKRKLHPLLAKLGIERAGMHAFRHANASLMDRFGAPIKVRQERLGHTDARITLGDRFSGYTHSASEDDRRIASQLGNVLCPTCVEKKEGLEVVAPKPLIIQ